MFQENSANDALKTATEASKRQISKSLLKFREKGKLPPSLVYLERLGVADGDGEAADNIFNTLKSHVVKWHARCRVKYDSTRAKRLEDKQTTKNHQQR